MKEDLQNILEEILIRIINLEHNADLICADLLFLNCLSDEDLKLVARDKTASQKIMVNDNEFSM